VESKLPLRSKLTFSLKYKTFMFLSTGNAQHTVFNPVTAC